jgi:hypothetical protein
MKTILTAIVLGAMLAACQTSGTGTGQQTTTKAFKYGRGDGATMASAVQIRTRSETEGGVLIRDWIKANYPGYVISEQELIEQRDKAFNMITLLDQNNAAKRVYFDISTYYRRIGNDDFPKPLT